MNFALYIMSAAISILRYLYIVSKKRVSSSLLVVTVVEGGSILCAAYGRTCVDNRNRQGGCAQIKFYQLATVLRLTQHLNRDVLTA